MRAFTFGYIIGLLIRLFVYLETEHDYTGSRHRGEIR